jgi:hypothetical protein
MQSATCEPEVEEEKDSPEPSVFKAVDMLLKGLEVPLPQGRSFKDKDRIDRTRARVRWWDSGPMTYREATLLADNLRHQLPDLPVPLELPTYTSMDKPIFFGHYSLPDRPELLSDQIACVDYGAGPHGPLCAYSWNGETTLNTKSFCLVQTQGH